MILLEVSILAHFVQVLSHNYCNSEECPGYSIISSWQVRDVSDSVIAIKWDVRKQFEKDVRVFKIQWMSPFNCSLCSGWTTVNESHVELRVEPCTNYTFEIYPLDSSLGTIKAPAVFSQVTANSLLNNGTALLVGDTWAVLRWLQDRSCPNSSYIGICHGPNTICSVKRACMEGVVIFNFSGLLEKTSYICGAHTINSAGSSSPARPVFFTTSHFRALHDEKLSHMYEMLVIFGMFAFIAMAFLLLLMRYLQSKRNVFPWRGSYAVNAP